MNLNNIIAGNLKRLRNERQLSLSKLSDICGVSKVMLGQIERGESNPTINTIWKIAGGLRVPYTSLIDEPIKNDILIKKEDSRHQESPDNKYRVYCYFASNSNRNFELFTVELDGNSTYESNSHGEKTQEYIIVYDGELSLNVDNITYVLTPGDSIVFDSSKPHSYINLNSTTIRMTIINNYLI
ncbi:helix-turn-helix domain-containing protein [Clostridium beijerinckii]|uniref:Transcriptional regulator with XRE-family HTH domain n=1 Tax=Clostridium beijerinckii TaxID=1520 RepID=A0A9Q5CQT2_CLOBE|nr:XRE family transcriptional regulator [Clostridium beijerinckii]AQS07010.1 HTH-type transcriptional regulator PuuR [Clostridium beijerinckii]MBA2883506.1 transcriptional regulator with XRE-family HTH domain [Clostridium beijerinckii]MBA2898693.1 transcriptional regulator with XRE-family HTH domain [Clostridium beijerinckii]MBA2908093.1 transcriptional regulator with XRE-family HTH domain [Clostridium beijerinckii]MBA9013359.1 transcriptional regulator with XRE-family HTH domain [Clostridium 